MGFSKYPVELAKKGDNIQAVYKILNEEDLFFLLQLQKSEFGAGKALYIDPSQTLQAQWWQEPHV